MRKLMDVGVSGLKKLKIRTNVGLRNEKNRAEWVQTALAKIPAGWRILDAGAGEQQFRTFCQHLEYVSQDFAKYDGVGDEKGLQSGEWDVNDLDIVSDITDIPEPDSSFDAILCTEVFEHIPEPIKAIKEFNRLLKQGGTLILTAPFCSLTHFAPYHYYSGFNRYFWEKHLGDLRYDIEELSPNGNFFEYIAQELRRIPITGARYCPSVHLKMRERLALRWLVSLLERLSNSDEGSDELLAYGYHVFARKRR